MPLTDTAPYGSTEPTIRTMETYRETGFGGAPVTVELIGRMGYKDEVARRVVLSLAMLRLIEEDGTPAPDFVAFKQAPSAEYKQVLRDVLFEAYAGVFAITGMDLSKKTQVELEDAFQPFRPDSLRKRMVALFIGLAEYTGLVEKIERKKPGPRTGASGGSAPRRPPAVEPTRRTPNPKKTPTPTPAPTQAPPNGDSHTVELLSGGQVTLTVSARMFDLVGTDDWEFVSKLIASMKNYPQEATKV